MQTCARVTQEKRAGRCHKRAGKSRRPSARRAHLIAAVKEKDKLDIRFAIHDCVPTLKVVLITGEAIYEEAKLLFIFLHGLFHRLQGGNGKRKRDRLGDGKTQDKRQTNCFNAKSIRFVTGTSKLRQKGAQIWFFAPPFCFVLPNGWLSARGHRCPLVEAKLPRTTIKQKRNIGQKMDLWSTCGANAALVQMVVRDVTIS